MLLRDVRTLPAADRGRRSGGGGRGAGSRRRRSALLRDNHPAGRRWLDHDRSLPDDHEGHGGGKRGAIRRGQALRGGHRGDPVGMVIPVQQHGPVAGTVPMMMGGKSGTRRHQRDEQAQGPDSVGPAGRHE